MVEATPRLGPDTYDKEDEELLSGTWIPGGTRRGGAMTKNGSRNGEGKGLSPMDAFHMFPDREQAERRGWRRRAGLAEPAFPRCALTDMATGATRPAGPARAETA